MATCPICRTHYEDDQEHCPADGALLLLDEAFANADLDLQPGDKVGEYEVVEAVGRGGFGTVYKAIQPLIGKKVAVKVLKRQFSANPEIASRFIAEAKAVNQIEHRYIIDIFSFGELPDGRHYYVMKYLDGKTLEQIVNKRGQLTVSEALPILRAVAEAIDAAHAKGIAHRDLKPDNVFVEKHGNVQLLDFGIAKLMDEDTDHKTRTGAMMGTPLYMSPEQCHGRNVDHRTDIYAFGVMAFQLLAGRVPFVGASSMDIMFQHCSTSPPNPSEIGDGLARELDEPILRMLAKKPEDRPESLAAACAALEKAARDIGIEVANTLNDLGSNWYESPSTGSRAMALDPTIASDSAVPNGSTSSMMGGESRAPTAPARGKSRVAMAVAGAIAVAAAAAFVIFGGSIGTDEATGESSAPPADTTTQDNHTAAARGAATLAPRIEAAHNPAESNAEASKSEPAEPPIAPPEVSPSVTIDIQGTPKGTEVVGPGDKVLGTAPGAIELARGDRSIVLTFRKKGYTPAKQAIIPKADGIVSVAMTRKRKPRPRKKPAGKKPGQKPDKDALEEAF